MRTCWRARQASQPDRWADFRALLLIAWAGGLAACSPVLNWREVRPPEANLGVLLPCRPDEVVRRVSVADWHLALHLVSCEAQGQVFALAHAEVPSGASAVEVLGALREATAANLGVGRGTATPAWHAPGLATASALQRLHWRGTRSDGSTLVLEAVYFGGGDRVYQASIVGSSSESEVAEMFFSNLRLTP